MIQPPTRPDSAADLAGQPAWDVARLFPVQGNWTASGYFALDTNRLVELVDGSLEVLALDAATKRYVEQARGGVGTQVTSTLLSGFTLEVSQVFAAT